MLTWIMSAVALAGTVLNAEKVRAGFWFCLPRIFSGWLMIFQLGRMLRAHYLRSTRC